MKPTQELINAPAAPSVQPDLLPSTQPFEALLARYKARVYESYGHEIGRMGEATEWSHPLPADDTKAE